MLLLLIRLGRSWVQILVRVCDFSVDSNELKSKVQLHD